QDQDVVVRIRIHNSVPPQQGTTFYGSYGGNNSQSTASSYHNGSSKSTTGRVPAQQYSDYKSKTADQFSYYYNSISSGQGQQLGGAGYYDKQPSKGTTKRYPSLKG
ncbi:Os08g0353700, partial [Oryza sativa Japonica Group]